MKNEIQVVFSFPSLFNCYQSLFGHLKFSKQTNKQKKWCKYGGPWEKKETMQILLRREISSEKSACTNFTLFFVFIRTGCFSPKKKNNPIHFKQTNIVCVCICFLKIFFITIILQADASAAAAALFKELIFFFISRINR